MKLPTKESEEEVINGDEGNRPGPSANTGEGSEVGAEGGPANPSNGEAAPDFSEFLWMEHEEEFNEQVLKELEDEEMVNYYFELYQASIEAELNTGQSTGPILRVPPPPTYLESHGHVDDRVEDLSRGFNRMNFSSSLNPEAAEFVPRGGGHDFINKDSTS